VTRRPRRSVTAVVGVVVPSVDRSMPGPVGASALDSQARESPALVLGGRLGRGPRGHGLVVHQLDTRGRRDVPHVRVSDSTEPVDIRRRNGPGRGRDGQDSEMSTRSQLAGRKLFGNPTPQSVPSPARRRIGPKREIASRGHSWYRSGRAAPGAVPGECLRRPRDLQWEGLPARTIVETRFCMGSPPQSRYSSPCAVLRPSIRGR